MFGRSDSRCPAWKGPRRMVITSNLDLAAFCRELLDRPWCALDTEFTWTRTYLPRLGLIQLGTPDRVAAVDMTRITDPEPLRAVFAAPGLIKVVHALDQDARIISREFGVLPVPSFDTQIGAGLLGLGEQIGYAALIRHFLAIEVDKTEQFTDWVSRPLRPGQIAYALDDVRHLSETYPLMVNALDRLGRLDWVLEDSAEAAMRSAVSDPADAAVLQTVRGRGRLGPAAAYVLDELAQWREDTARREDCRPRRIMPDAVLLRLAGGGRIRDADLSGMWRSQARKVRSFLPEAMRVAASARSLIAAGEADLPVRQTVSRMSSAEKKAFAAAWTGLSETADRLGVPRSCLATRAEMEALVRAAGRGEREPVSRLLRGWRREQFGAAVYRELIRRLGGDVLPTKAAAAGPADGRRACGSGRRRSER